MDCNVIHPLECFVALLHVEGCGQQMLTFYDAVILGDQISVCFHCHSSMVPSRPNLLQQNHFVDPWCLFEPTFFPFGCKQWHPCQWQIGICQGQLVDELASHKNNFRPTKFTAKCPQEFLFGVALGPAAK